LVVVLAAKGREVLLVVGEGEALDQHLVQFEALHNLQSVEVPNDDVRLNSVSKSLAFKLAPLCRNRFS